MATFLRRISGETHRRLSFKRATELLRSDVSFPIWHNQEDFHLPFELAHCCGADWTGTHAVKDGDLSSLAHHQEPVVTTNSETMG